MPRFFFDISDGQESWQDPEGSILDDLGAAQREATDTLAQMGRELFPGSDGRALTVEIRAEDGKALMQVALRLSTIPH